jgi:hypothetical protein
MSRLNVDERTDFILDGSGWSCQRGSLQRHLAEKGKHPVLRYCRVSIRLGEGEDQCHRQELDMYS